MKTLKEWVRNKSTKTITITCRDNDDTLEEMLKYIKEVGNMGHTFTIIVDPGEKGGKKFEWDGDGSDAIFEIRESKMPGPISDSYDPEFGTSVGEIDSQLKGVYDKLSNILSNKDPIYIVKLIDMDLPDAIEAKLTEKEWRLLRFCVERARDSI